jgi:hypothetical protein
MHVSETVMKECDGLSIIRAKGVEPELSKNVNTIQK